MTLARARRRLHPLLSLAVALTVGACDDGRSEAASDPLAGDSSLARDLTLARPDRAPTSFADTTAVEPPAAPVTPERPTPPPSPAPVVRRRSVDVAAAPRATTPRTVPTPRTPAPRTPAPSAPLPSAAAPAPVRVPAAVPAPDRGQLAAGSSLGFTTSAQMCSDRNTPGDKIIATLDAPTTGTRGFFLPAGTKAVLELASVERDADGNPTGIIFRVRNLDDGATAYRVPGAEVTVNDSLQRERAPGTPGATRRGVATGVVLGAVLGQVLGKDTRATVIGAAAGGAAGAVRASRGRKYERCLPAGAKILVRFTEVVTA